MKKNIKTISLALTLFIVSSAAAAASSLTIADTWYDIYGIIYEGTNHGRSTGEIFNVTRNGKTIGAFELFHVEADLSKGKFKSSTDVRSLMKGDSLEPASPEPGASGNDPKNAQYHFELGLGHLNSKNPQKALQELTIAVKGDPDNPDIHEALAAAYIQLKNDVNAKHEQEMAERLRNSSGQTITPASAAPEQPKPETKTVERQDPSVPSVLHAKPLKFEPEVAKPAQKTPEKEEKPPPRKSSEPSGGATEAGEPSFGRIDALLKQLKAVGKTERDEKQPSVKPAEPAGETSKPNEPSGGHIVSLSEHLKAVGKTEKEKKQPSVKPAEPAGETSKPNEQSGGRIDSLLEQLKAVGKAENEKADEEEASSWNPDNNVEQEQGEETPREAPILSDFSSGFNNLGVLKIQAGELREAVSYFDRALEAHPNQPVFHRNKAVALAKLGKYEQALICAEDALRLGDLRAPDLIQLIKSMMKQ